MGTAVATHDEGVATKGQIHLTGEGYRSAPQMPRLPYHSIMKWMEARESIDKAHADFARQVAEARANLDKTLNRAQELIVEAQRELSVLVPFPDNSVSFRHGSSWDVELITVGRACNGEVYLTTRRLPDLFTAKWPGEATEEEVVE